MHQNKLIVFLFLLAFSSSMGQSMDNENTTIKVLSFNILHGATTKGDFNLDAIAKVIIEADPDFVALQEVDYKTNRARNYDLATELGWRSKLAPLFASAMSYDGGEYGEAILSRYAIISSRKVDLPFTPGNEPRTALEITTILPSGDTICFIGTHLDHLKEDTDRFAQAQKINEVFQYNTHPTVLAGDLNDIPGSRTITKLEEHWVPSYNRSNPQPTYPSVGPSKKIDYVLFIPNGRWKVVDNEVIEDSVASDHCAYLVTLSLQKN
jgi:endonuclease/exonuclease/phosphatase family metal-dependent hydrolase